MQGTGDQHSVVTLRADTLDLQVTTTSTEHTEQQVWEGLLSQPWMGSILNAEPVQDQRDPVIPPNQSEMFPSGFVKI